MKFTLLCLCRVFSQHIATGEFDPTREDWLYQLQQMAAPAHREADADIRRHIRTLLPACVRRDEDRGFFSTLTEDEAMHQFNRQARRGAVTAVALSCLPLQLNTMR